MSHGFDLEDKCTDPKINLVVTRMSVFLPELNINITFHDSLTYSARVVQSPSHLVVKLRGRPTLGPYKSFTDVLLRLVVRRT